MATSSIAKNKNLQIVVLIALTAGVILFSLLTDFPEGDGQGALRNRRFGPAIQTPSQNYNVPTNGNLMPTTQTIQPIVNGYDVPTNGN